MKNAFECQQLSAGYDERLVLANLTLSVAEGEMTALLGPNGAGKSTLLRVLTGLLPPRTGRVMVFGQELTRLDAARRSRLIAVVPQELKTPMAYTVAELVTMGRTAGLRPWERLSAADRQIVERAMVYTDVSDLQDRSLDTLSGGEKQRAVVAMALAQEPRVILMDEPTTHLDMNHALEIMQIIERLNREQRVTVLMTSHDLNLAAAFCHRLILLDRGQVAADGAPADVLREDRLREIYHCDFRVQPDPQSGTVLVVPASRLTPPDSSGNLRVHVIAGGGSGGEVFRRLSLGGYRVTCGVLNQRDTDVTVAEALGVKLVLEKPFSPVGVEALARARQAAQDAAVVILCEVPFGPGNVVNLDIAEEALRRGAQVFLNDRNLDSRDYSPQRAAVTRIRQLLQQGALAWRQVSAVMNRLAKL